MHRSDRWPPSALPTVLSTGIVLFVLVVLAAAATAQPDAGVSADSGPADSSPADTGVSADVQGTRDAGADRSAASECRRSARDFLSGLADIGAAERRRQVRELCADGGPASMSTDEAVDVILDDTDDFDFLGGSGRSWIDWLFVALELGVVLAVIFGSVWIHHRRKERFDAIMDEADPAFDLELAIDELRADPDLLERIREDVSEVCIMRLPSSQGGGTYGGSRMTVSYAAFVLDTHGETHEFTRDDSWEQVQNDAAWLADRLDVEIRDESYG